MPVGWPGAAGFRNSMSMSTERKPTSQRARPIALRCRTAAMRLPAIGTAAGTARAGVPVTAAAAARNST